MKKLTLSLLLALALLLAGCGAPKTEISYAPSETATPSGTAPAASPTEQNTQSGASLQRLSSYGRVSTGEGYYQTSGYYDSADQYMRTIVFTDYAAKAQREIYSTTREINYILHSEGNLYLPCGQDLIRLGMDGSGETVFATLGEDEYFSAEGATDSEFLYLRAYRFTYDYMAGGPKDGEDPTEEFWISISLQDGSITHLQGAGQVSLTGGILGIYKDMMVFSDGEPVDEFHYNNTLYGYSPSRGQTEELLSFSAGWGFHLKGENIYSLYENNGDSTLLKINLATGGETESTLDIPCEADCYVETLYGDTLLLAAFDGERMQHYSFTEATGEIQRLTLTYLTHDTLPDRLAEANGKLLVQYKFEDFTRTDTGPDGNTYQYEDMRVHYALIPVEDYIAGNQSYDPIEMLFYD